MRLDSQGGSEFLAGVVLSLYGEKGPLLLHRRDGLETCPGEGANEFQLVRSGAGEHPPGCDLRGAVPTNVYIYLISFTAFGDNRWPRLRLAFPGEAEGSV